MQHDRLPGCKAHPMSQEPALVRDPDRVLSYVTGYPASLPDEHMLLHACASAIISGPLHSIQLTSQGALGERGIAVHLRKKSSGRTFRAQQRLLPVGSSQPSVSKWTGRQPVTKTVKHSPGEVPSALAGASCIKTMELSPAGFGDVLAAQNLEVVSGSPPTHAVDLLRTITPLMNKHASARLAAHQSGTSLMPWHLQRTTG